MSGTYGYEQTRSEPEFIVPTSGAMAGLLPNDGYKKAISYMKANTDLEKDETLRAIRDFNIFDYKYVRNRTELEKEADRKYARAEKLYKERKINEARKILKGILLTWPSHLSSRELLKKIEASQATPTPTPPRPRPSRTLPRGIAR